MSHALAGEPAQNCCVQSTLLAMCGVIARMIQENKAGIASRLEVEKA
jgi:hypothetical protein